MIRDDATVNGHSTDAQPKKKPPRTRKKKPLTPEELHAGLRKTEEKSIGRCAASVKKEEVSWLVEGWIPKKLLTMVIGESNTGKSTFSAWLISQAGRAAFLPGHEEPFALMHYPRMERQGVRFKDLLLLDDEQYTFPAAKNRVVQALRNWKARALILDPLDSYLGDTVSENDGPSVRAYLESLQAVADEANCAVVGIRHPGKDTDNICPGSRSWLNVPRVRILLGTDGRMPVRRFMKLDKDGCGTGNPPLGYELRKLGKEAPLFVLGKEVDTSLARLAKVTGERGMSRKVVEAAKLLRQMFEEKEKPLVKDFVNRCKEMGIGSHVCDETKAILSIDSSNLGPGEPWHMIRLEKAWPEWMLESLEPPK